MDCRSGKIEKWIKKHNIYWVVIALLISIAEAVILKTVGCADGFVTSQIKFGSFMYAATLALWLINNRTEPRRNILSIYRRLFLWHFLLPCAYTDDHQESN